MYLYFNKIGVLKEIINDDALRQGNYNVNKIYVYVEDRPSYTDIDVSYLLPSGLVVGPMNYDTFEEVMIPFDAKRDLKFFKYNQTYRFCVIDLESDLNGNSPLDQAGIVHCNLEIVQYDYQIALGEVNFVVEVDSVLNQRYVASEEYMSLSNYQYLRGLIAGRYGTPATQEWVEDQHYLTSATYDYVNTLAELRQALSDGKKFIVLGSNFSATVDAQITVPEHTIIVGNGGTFNRATGYEDILFDLRPYSEISNIVINGNRSNMVSPTWDTTIEMTLRGNNYVHDVEMNHPNEAIVAFGSFNRIEHCKFTDCGGNAIHFSAGVHTVVDGCYVDGANKRSGMGHEDGCIIWSDECRFIDCVNNYVRDGKTGFGAIDTYDNSYVKIVNNTIIMCTNSFDLVTTRDQAVDVLIQGNFIFNSGTMEMNKTSDSLTAQARYMVLNNFFVKSTIEIQRLDTIAIQNNFMLDGSIRIVKSTNVKIENNNIRNFSNRVDTLQCGECANVSILGNYIRGDYSVVNCYDSTSVTFANNKIRAYSTDGSKTALHPSTVMNGSNNEIISYTNGVELNSYYSLVNNVIYLKDTDKYSIVEYNDATNILCAFNRTNATNTLYDADGDSHVGNQNVSNMTGTASGLFLTVTNSLTNITTSGSNSVIKGDDYYAILTASAGHGLPESVTISMGGTQEVGPNEFIYERTTGELIVFGVTANLTITATAV